MPYCAILPYLVLLLAVTSALQAFGDRSGPRAQAIYFQPHPNFSSKPVKRVPLDDVLHVFRRTWMATVIVSYCVRCLDLPRASSLRHSVWLFHRSRARDAPLWSSHFRGQVPASGGMFPWRIRYPLRRCRPESARSESDSFIRPAGSTASRPMRLRSSPRRRLRRVTDLGGATRDNPHPHFRCV